MCMAMSFTRLWKSGVLATKSVSQLTSTSTPTLRAGVDVVADHALAGGAARLLGGARPGPSCAGRRAPSPCRPWPRPGRDLQSIMPAPVSSRSLRTISAEMSHVPSLILVERAPARPRAQRSGALEPRGSARGRTRRQAVGDGRRRIGRDCGRAPRARRPPRRPPPRPCRRRPPRPPAPRAGRGRRAPRRRCGRRTAGWRAARRRCPGSRSRPRPGSQFVSTMPTTGIFSLRASWTAIASLRVSITKMASGTVFMPLMPGRFFSSLHALLLEARRPPSWSGARGGRRLDIISSSLQRGRGSCGRSRSW